MEKSLPSQKKNRHKKKRVSLSAQAEKKLKGRVRWSWKRNNRSDYCEMKRGREWFAGSSPS